MLAVAIAAPLGLRHWATTPQGSGEAFPFELPPGTSAMQLAALLHRAGLVSDPRAMGAYLTVLGWFDPVAPGPHMLKGAKSPSQLWSQLARRPHRQVVHLVIPEGFNRFQIAMRLEQLGICQQADFVRASGVPFTTPSGIQRPSAEGYLFPAKYELFVNTRGKRVLQRLVDEATRRRATLPEPKPGSPAQALEWTLDELIVLASIVEREAAGPDEYGLVASVFFNRLLDPDFRPRGRLQSDPTAAYGCQQSPELASCDGFSGTVTPELLRARDNPYNTYRHAGLPPGPISNPGQAALKATIAPPKTDFLFFYAPGGASGHVFSRTWQEHRNAIAGREAP